VTVFALSNYTRELAAVVASLAKEGKAARADGGVSLLRQFLELLLLRSGSGKLRPDDYYKLRVYRREIRFSEKRHYLSSQALPHSIFGRWAIVAADKLLTYGILSGAGIAVPKIRAVCHKLREYGNCSSLKTVEDVAGYLRNGAPFPLIAKPVLGSWSRNVCLLKHFDVSTQSVSLDRDGSYGVHELAERFLSFASGYLLQELLLPHPEIRDSISNRICSLRVIILLEGSRSRLFTAVWKINASDSVADNYWRDGNLLAKLDQKSGEILQCTMGYGPSYRVVDRHPRTEKPLAGFRVPRYAESIALALRASKLFPGIPVQAWDIAITDDGPIPLELNAPGSFFLPQLVSDEGIWSGDFRTVIQTLSGN
jgi:Sugar-transfer associated ATP-grasp